MSDISFDRSATLHRPKITETIHFRLLVIMLFVFAAIGILIGRLTGHKHELSLWKEAKQAAYATAGYAFKY